MTIHFKYGGKPYNNPDNEKHKRIQEDFRQMIDGAIEENKQYITIESRANIEIDYTEESVKTPGIKLNGFGPDSQPKIFVIIEELLKGLNPKQQKSL